jgi:hypothetical protein
MSLIPFSYWKSKELGVITNGLVLHLDAATTNSYSGSGSTWNDISGNGNNATLSGPTFSTTNGGQFDFDGINDFATVPNASSLNPTSQITLSLWVSSDFPGAFRSPIMKSSSFNWDDGYGIFQDGAGNFSFFINLYNGSQTVTVSRSSFTIRNIVGVYDGTNLKLYENGSLIATGSSYSTAITNSSTQLNIGRGGGDDFYWDGLIAQILVYNRGLSATEVLENFNITKIRFGL